VEVFPKELEGVQEDGGLMSYGPDLGESYRGTAALADKVLKGAHPANLPVEEPTQFSLCINLKTAKALGLTIPPMFPCPRRPGDRIIAGTHTHRTARQPQLAASFNQAKFDVADWHEADMPLTSVNVRC
jgi:ABC-type uncharacterized transport system substrate-binding protein